MSIFQRTTIALARSPAMGRAMRAVAARTSLAQRFVGGADVDAAVRTAQRLRDAHGIRASLFYLGEYVAEPAAIEHNVSQAINACGALAAAGLDVHVSVDPTAIGYMASDALGEANARRIGQAVRQPAGQATGQATGQEAGAGRNWMVLDMEDAGIRERTCALHRGLLQAGLPVGLTLQARRRRTPEDLAWAIRQQTSLRLVKGAFPERALDHAGRDRIDHAYLDAAAIMLSREAREAGFYPVFGTHDDRLAGAIMALARERGWSPDAFEFEMLYGVRPDWQLALRGLGYNVRVYLPFGGDWWPYAIRRVGENPGNAWLLARSLKADGGYFG
ncbi:MULTISPECIES: proline dehydrogenase family protein [Achromobacter]|uniref:Proline dehydrogenase family protein n=1 Tax=Achromobacter spanius TaxID=217203 RepID=A0ABY8GUT4_9BURK|nr:MULTISPECIES: proline dehydrogenase family protein [Achromobacter]WAI82221.1 proline dehydrogenase family protein [Achromobacter spanius]WEX92309.1 proline dehydrogenase family protein [Achromobacter sp. SS2-2022]WFP08541.1 proline dehydrogenase family protein [Achromobacter spanius]